MNYFDFYEIPIQFELSASELKKKFLQFSKLYHPDRHVLEDTEKQAAMMEKSLLNTQAYKILSDPMQRMHYILEQEGVISEEGKNAIPQDFLMEMMDVNEKLMELEFGFDENIYTNVANEVSQIKNNLDKQAANWFKETVFPNPKKEVLLKIKDYYFKSKYILRLQNNLSKFAHAKK